MCSYMKQKRPGFQYPVKHFAIVYSLWNKNKNNMSKTVSCNIISCCYKKLYCKKQIIISMYSGSHLHILVNSLPSCVVCIIFCPFLLHYTRNISVVFVITSQGIIFCYLAIIVTLQYTWNTGAFSVVMAEW